MEKGRWKEVSQESATDRRKKGRHEGRQGRWKGVSRRQVGREVVRRISPRGRKESGKV